MENIKTSKLMKYIWKVEIPEWPDCDQYEGFICIAPDEQTARQIHPATDRFYYSKGEWCHRHITDMHGKPKTFTRTDWPEASEIDILKVTQLGVAHDEYESGTVLLSDFRCE